MEVAAKSALISIFFRHSLGRFSTFNIIRLIHVIYNNCLTVFCLPFPLFILLFDSLQTYVLIYTWRCLYLMSSNKHRVKDVRYSISKQKASFKPVIGRKYLHKLKEQKKNLSQCTTFWDIRFESLAGKHKSVDFSYVWYC